MLRRIVSRNNTNAIARSLTRATPVIVPRVQTLRMFTPCRQCCDSTQTFTPTSFNIVNVPIRKTMKQYTVEEENLHHPSYIFTAYHVARNLNVNRETNSQLKALIKQYQCNVLEDSGKGVLVVQMRGNDDSVINKNHQSDDKVTGMTDVGLNTSSSFIVLYHFGSICFVNCDETLQQQWIQNLPIDTSNFTITKDYLRIAVDNSASDWCKMARDHVILSKLDLNNLNIISGSIARSVALKFYETNSQVILADFRRVNKNIESSGKITKGDEVKLIPVLSHVNTLKCELLLSVKVLEKPDVTWLFHRYDQLHEMLQSEFEIHDRFTYLEKGLDFIQQNNRFYMELQHSKRMSFAEWLIIVLIATELFIAVKHHMKESEMRENERH